MRFPPWPPCPGGGIGRHIALKMLRLQEHAGSTPAPGTRDGTLFMVKNVVVKKSRISGKDIFAKRGFSRGEVVLIWKPKLIKKSELKAIPKEERAYIERVQKKFYLMQSPERYVNHSCDPNTVVKNKSDIALRNIKKGEKITSDYSGTGIQSFRCRCGSGMCKKIIN